MRRLDLASLELTTVYDGTGLPTQTVWTRDGGFETLPYFETFTALDDHTFAINQMWHENMLQLVVP